MTTPDAARNAQIARLAPLRARLAAVFGVVAPALLPVRGFGHAMELLSRLGRDGAACPVPCASIVLREGLVGEEASSILRDRPDAILLHDERRLEWTTGPSLASLASGTRGLVVYREIGAAFGREDPLCGVLVGEASLIDHLEAVIDADFLHPLIAVETLKAVAPQRLSVMAARTSALQRERARLVARLGTAKGIGRLIDQDGADLRAEVAEPEKVLARARALEARLLQLPDKTIRIEIGDAEGNDRTLVAFGVDPARKAPRIAEARRDTNETKIAVRVDLDCAGEVKVETGVGYFDHMLEQVAAHGGFSLTLACEGDRHVDLHHTIEDCALTLGTALSKALGERRGIARYGFTLPMDEAQATVSIDLGGRPYCVFDGNFAAPLLGEYPTEMTSHVFRSLSQSLGAAIHVCVAGENDHHKTEAAFKAFARALRAAIAIEGDALPSTKGLIG